MIPFIKFIFKTPMIIYKIKTNPPKVPPEVDSPRAKDPPLAERARYHFP